MTWLSLGSLSLPFQLQRHGAQVRTDIARLGTELAGGRVADPVRHLRGDTGPLAQIAARLDRIEAVMPALTARGVLAEATQGALGQIETLRAATASMTLGAASTGAGPTALADAGRQGRQAFTAALAALGTGVAGVSVLSGDRSDRAPLGDADAILADLSALVTGLGPEDAAQAIDAAMRAPGGLFETAFYQGGAEGPGPVGADGLRGPALPTAADPALRAVLSGLAMAALIGDPALGFSPGQSAALAQRSAETLLTAAGPLATLQGRVGAVQGALDADLARMRGERDALAQAQSGLVGADPYEVATRLESARTQLETIYAVTARTARLSLVEYLR